MNPCRAVTVLCLIAVIGGTGIGTPAWGDDGQEETTRSAETLVAEAPQPAAADNQDEEKQRKAMAGLLALCGILIGGLMFVVIVMIWGARLRRLARRELPPQTTLQNEHWFLKPPKGCRQSRIESQQPDSSEGNNSGS